MNLTGQLHLAAGLGALVLGFGVVLRDAGRLRNRLFALLCGSLALWSLGVSARQSLLAPDFPWQVVLLLGSCSAAPLSLHFAVAVADLKGRLPRAFIGLGYAAAGILWLSTLSPRYRRPTWNLEAMFLLGVILLAALLVLTRHVISLPPGRQRRVYRMVLLSGILAVAGGLSDFLPRDTVAFPSVGPVFVLLFLLVVSAVVVRHRFLDVDVYLARSVALLTGATAVALLLLAVTTLFGARFIPLFAASLLVLAVAGPLGRLMLSRARDLLGGDDPLTGALVSTSRKLPPARDAEQVWRAIEEGSRALPGDVRVAVYLHASREAPFRPVFPTKREDLLQDIGAASALPRLLRKERSPVTRALLDVEAHEGVEETRTEAREALAQMASLKAEMIVPLLSENHLLGWISVGGGESDAYLRAEVAAAFLAVGHQAVASLERIQAMDEARRREALAAVGTMAAGLAHEVRNPLAAIRGAAQAITPGIGAEETGEMLEVIEEESARLGRVVGEFLDYARPASPRRESVDLGEIMRRIIRTMELSGSRLHIELDVAPGAPPATGDPDQILRAFENLVRNAAEAAPAGGTLKVHVAQADTSRTVRIRFEDDGPGIPGKEIPHLFQPFRTFRPGGTGLGLALVHRIVEAHGGEIGVEGRPGKGAIFTLSFPSWSPPREG